jgi:protein-S-isoprenylcysteine O-methyltransferase Ste14
VFDSYERLVVTCWALWALYWMLCAAHVKRTARREPLWSRASHVLPMTIAFALLAAPGDRGDTVLFARFVPVGAVPELAGSLMVLAGLLFAIWARVHLGSNWSGRVTLKQNHELIRTGPYRWVRHPIYSGLLLAILGTALVVGEWRGLIATALMIVSFWRKLRLEEALMRETFGQEYTRYCERTAALVPYVI